MLREQFDDLLQGESFWTRTGLGSSHAYAPATAGYTLTATGTDGFFADLGGASEAWTAYRLNLRLELEGANHAASVWVLMTTEGDRDASYQVDLDGLASEVRIIRLDAGTPTTLATATGITIAAGYGYDWSIEAEAGGASTSIRVYQDGLLRASAVDSSGSRKAAGGVAWAGENAAAQVSLHHALAFAMGTTNTRIGPHP